MNTPFAVVNVLEPVVRYMLPWLRPSLLTCALAIGLTAPVGSARAELEIDTQRNRDRLTTYVGMFNELTERRRKVIYTDYPVSPYHGVVHNFVHVSDGSAAFARTDLVVDGALPIAVRRAYHSGSSAPAEFGNSGWRLTLQEQIRDSGQGGFEYRYGNGTTLSFDEKGRVDTPFDAYSSDVTRAKIHDGESLAT